MLLLRNTIQPYAWGRVDGIAGAVGTEPTGGPEAELWVGTHPAAPSVVDAGEHAGRLLGDVLADDPQRWLGPLHGRAPDALPFLLKVLAIAEPLSLQAHPSAVQAADGFAREDAAGIPLDGPVRTFKDPNAKPEALVAVTPVTALCGFRPPARAAALVARAASPALAPLVEALSHEDEHEALRSAMAWLLHLYGDARGEVAAAAAAAGSVAAASGADEAWTWVDRLATAHPGDPGCLAPLLLEVLHLAPGEAVHLPAGNLHAYLEGVGVEIMGASDNVLRGGLTPKHVDVDGLLGILRFEAGIPAQPVAEARGALVAYRIPERAFALARLDPQPAPVALGVPAPTLLLPVGAPATIERDGEVLAVGHGRAAFVEPGPAVVVRSEGPVWWATVGDGLPPG